MNITLPPAVEQSLTPEAVALHLAIGLFVTEVATLGQAAQTAGLSQADFLRELGRRRISIHYGPDELAWLYRSIEHLSAVDKAFVLLYLEDRSYEEMADILGITQNNVRVKMHRVQEKLRTLMTRPANVF